MPDEKLTQKAAITTAASTDLAMVVTDPAGTPATKKMTLLNLIKSLLSLVGITADGSTAVFSVDVSVPDEAYDATAWNGSLEAPTKNAVRDKFESLPSASGDVVGPASSTDNAVARYDGTTGKLLQNSAVTIADTTGNMAGVGTLNTHTIPGGTDTFTLNAATQTLTNKTLTAPKFESAGFIADANGNELIKFPATVASAVNEITVSPAATGNAPEISATGGDTNVGLKLTPKGTGSVTVAGDIRAEADGTRTIGASAGNRFWMFPYGLSVGNTNIEAGGVRFGAGSNTLRYTSGFLQLGSGVGLGWSSGDPGAVAEDVRIVRTAANALRINNAGSGAGLLQRGRVVTPKTSNYTVTALESDTFFTNTGAGAGVTFTLPTPTAGQTFEFYRDANQTVTVDIAAGVTIRVGTSVTTDGGNVTLDAVGSRLRIIAISATQWVGEISGTATFN